MRTGTRSPRDSTVEVIWTAPWLQWKHWAALGLTVEAVLKRHGPLVHAPDIQRIGSDLNTQLEHSLKVVLLTSILLTSPILHVQTVDIHITPRCRAPLPAWLSAQALLLRSTMRPIVSREFVDDAFLLRREKKTCSAAREFFIASPPTPNPGLAGDSAGPGCTMFCKQKD